MKGIKFIRQALLDITASQLGKKLNVSRAAVSDWELGKTKISEEQKNKIFALCHINKQWYERNITKKDMIQILLETMKEGGNKYEKKTDFTI